jgi:Zn-dependent protease
MENKLKISPGVYIFGALCLLAMPIRWAAGILIAALIHELSHIAAVILCGGNIYSVSLGLGGARIEAGELSLGKSVCCALAGPVGSLSALIFSECFPEAALCGLIQGLYNLFPLYPLDGGRILRFLLPEPACRAIEVFFLIVGTGLSLWVGVFYLDLGYISAISLWFPVIQRKFSCKDGKLAVQ